MAFTLRLSQFEGPLDMLLYLIGKAKIDIKDIFVSEITDQYIQSIQNAPDLDMNDASAFINMAATLIEIKSRTLLPKEKEEIDEEDPEAVLIRQLQEYQRIKQIAEDMKGFEKTAALLYSKLPEEYPLPPPTFELKNLTLPGLMEAFARVLARLRKAEDSPHEEVRRIIRDEYTIPRCTQHILRKLKKGNVLFSALISVNPSRDEIVTLFLALLELIRLGKATVTQDSIYDDILLMPTDKTNTVSSEEIQDGYQ